MSERAVPILPSRDLAETLDFYERLGFDNRGAPPEQWGYVILGRGTVELHFISVPDVDPLATASSCFVFVENAAALYADWATKITPDPATGSRIVPPVETDYDMTEFAVVDRSGNLVRVGTPHSA